MNALAGLQLLAKDSAGKYALTPESSAFLVTTKPGFQGGVLRHMSAQLIPKWLHLSDVVRTGQPEHAVNNESTGPAFFQQFVEDIFPMSYPAAQALAVHLKLGAAGKPVKVLDLAAGSGVWGIGLAQTAPNVSATAVDWPDVLRVTQRVVERFGLTKQFRFVPGDLADADFGAGYDLAILGQILHSEGAGKSRDLLRKAFQALAPGGTIAIAEFLVNEDRTAPAMGLIFAVNMLVNTDEGDTFSFKEISQWLGEAGFENPRTLDSPAPSPLILANKPK
jgi:ubiquinone/menaquinone biosynthesis C-methylase UbiE